MTATEEALAAMKKTEEAWSELAKRTVAVSGQFQKECQEFQKEQREWFLGNVPNQPKQDPRFLP
tara:strand:- start:3211 stop:3402 length:192 start_codon:yes stop_codon:yes gene_type:complete